MKTLDVLYVYRDLGPRAGGLAVDIRNLANGLAHRGWGTGVAFIDHGAAPEGFDPRVRLFPLPASRSGVARAFGLTSGIRAVVDRARICHVVSLLPVYMHFAAMESARRRGSAVAITPMMHPARQRLWRGYGRYRAMEFFDLVAPYVARRADLIAAATAAEADFFRGKGASNIRLLPPAVDPQSLVGPADVLGFRQRHGLSSDVVLVAAQRLERRKGFEFAVAVLKRLRSLRADVTLAVIGTADGPGRTVPGVRYLGLLPDSELPSAIAASDVVFVPSLYEAFSRMVIEAWQQERPVVVTDGVALAAAVDKVGGGRVVPYGDVDAATAALDHILEHRKVAEEQGRAGRLVVEQEYLRETVVGRAEIAYSALLTGR